jgi:hypothetical protein
MGEHSAGFVFEGWRTARNGCATVAQNASGFGMTTRRLQGLRRDAEGIVTWELKLPPPKEKERLV